MVPPARLEQAARKRYPVSPASAPNRPARLTQPRRGHDPSRPGAGQEPPMRKEALFGMCAVFGTVIGLGVLCLRGEAD
jgi:hypothetical protein